MKRTWRSLWVVPVAIALLAGALALTWRSMAAQEEAPVGPLAGPAAQGPEAVVPGGPGFIMVNPFQFRPYMSTDSWAYSGDDLYNPGPAQAYYMAALTLPNNVTVSKLVVYYWDESESDLGAEMMRCPAEGLGCEFMALAASSGSEAAYRHEVDTTIDDPVVDQQSNSYLVQVYLPPAGSALRLNAVRIDYAYTANLPLAKKN